MKPPRNEREHRTRTRGRSECPTPGCGWSKRSENAFCRSCWFDLPREVQDQVWASYRTRDLYDHVDFLMRIGTRLAEGAPADPWPEP